MLKLGTRLIEKRFGSPHTIDDIQRSDDGTLLYRPAPYGLYMIEAKIREDFHFVHTVSNFKKQSFKDWVKERWYQVSVFMETPVTKNKQ